MDARSPLNTDPRLLTLVSACLLLLVGCRGPWIAWPTDDRASVEAKAEDSAIADKDPATAAGADQPAETAAKAAPAGPQLPALDDDRWVQTVTFGNSAASASGFRWTHQVFEVWLADGNAPAALEPALTGKPPIVAANAAIVLARTGRRAGLAQLRQAIANRDLRLPQRLAAAEALGRLEEPEARAALGELVDSLGKYSGSAQAGYTPQLHAELLIALARRGDQADNDRFVAALASPAPEVRRAAVRAWLDPQRPGLPTAAIELEQDLSPLVRAAVVEALAVQHTPQAHEHLRRALDDVDPGVRMAAIAGLGQLGGPEARAALDTLRKHRSEIIRAGTVGALATIGDKASLQEATRDKSWRVRQAVAQTLRRAPEQTADIEAAEAAMALTLVHDTSLEVQRRTLESLASWPLSTSGPLFLAAMADGGFQTRKDAARQLTAVWPAAAAFPGNGSLAERTAALAELRTRWTTECGSLAASTATAPAAVGAGNTLPAEKQREFEEAFEKLRDPKLSVAARGELADSLAARGPVLLTALEQMSAPARQALAPAVYEEVLPKVGPVFAALAGLQGSDVHERRTAAAELLAHTSGQTISPVALARMIELARVETDALVWQSLLQVTAVDASEAALELAYMAVANPSPEVRRRACDYLARHPSSQHVPVLLPMLEDPNQPVAVAAVRALGESGSLDNPRPLVKLLLSTDKQLRLASACSLAQLKQAEGIAALERLALDDDRSIRQQTAAAIGRIQDPALLPTLIAMLGDSVDVQHTALESLPKLTGQDFLRDADGTPVPRGEQVRRWQQWYARHETTDSP